MILFLLQQLSSTAALRLTHYCSYRPWRLKRKTKEIHPWASTNWKILQILRNLCRGKMPFNPLCKQTQSCTTNAPRRPKPKPPCAKQPCDPWTGKSNDPMAPTKSSVVDACGMNLFSLCRQLCRKSRWQSPGEGSAPKGIAGYQCVLCSSRPVCIETCCVLGKGGRGKQKHWGSGRDHLEALCPVQIKTIHHSSTAGGPQVWPTPAPLWHPLCAGTAPVRKSNGQRGPRCGYKALGTWQGFGHRLQAARGQRRSQSTAACTEMQRTPEARCTPCTHNPTPRSIYPPPLVVPHPREDGPPPPPGGRSPSDGPPPPLGDCTTTVHVGRRGSTWQ